MDNILKPGLNEEEDIVPQKKEEYLKKDNYLAEYESEGDKAVIRENLNVYSRDNVYNKDEIDINIAEKIAIDINKYLQLEDPYLILPQVKSMIEGMLRTDGSTPFTAPLSGVDPVSLNHLTTRKYVDSLLYKHMIDDDAHDSAGKMELLLEGFATYDSVYSKNQVYTKNEIDALLKGFLKSNGSTPFTKPQVGFDPQVDNHLATKRYVDNIIYKHLVDIDPHNVMTSALNKLSSYAKLKDVYSKDQVFNKSEVQTLVNEAIETVKAPAPIIEENPKMVKSDGTTPFYSPQSGVRAKEAQHLTTLRLVKEIVDLNVKPIYDKLGNQVWHTNGPIEADLGLLKKGSVLAPVITFQELCDAIFYGNHLTIDFPKYTVLGEDILVTIYVHGSTGLLLSVEIYLEEELTSILEPDLFKENGSVTIEIKLIHNDLNLKVKANYTTGKSQEESKLIKMVYPTFVGLLPQWKRPEQLTYTFLKTISKLDLHGCLNLFIDCTPDTRTLRFLYNFDEDRRIFLAIPNVYRDLSYMIIAGLKITDITKYDTLFSIENLSIPYKIFVYNKYLPKLDREVTFILN